MLSKDNPEKAQDLVIDQYERQHHRGTSGFGLIEVSPKSVKTRRATEATGALVHVKFSKAPALLFHHRSPTSTANVLEQTHPMLIEHDELKFNYLVHHNGVIGNADERKKVHEDELGYIYKTYTGDKTNGTYRNKNFNDSESLAIDLVRAIEGKEQKVLSKGSAAYLVVQLNKKTGAPQRILWGRNEGNPLIISVFKDMIQIASVLNIGDEVAPDILYHIETKHLFSQTGNLNDQIKQRPLAFATYERHVASGTATPLGGKSYNWEEHNKTIAANNKTTTTLEENRGPSDDEPETEDERLENLTPRQKAFYTKFERDFAKMCDEVLWDFYVNSLAYEIPTETEIDEVTNSIKDIILESIDKTNKHRSWFDEQEAEIEHRIASEKAETEMSEEDQLAWAKQSGALDEIEAAEDGAPQTPPVNSALKGRPVHGPYMHHHDREID